MEKLYVVIYGDLNGDARINALDVSIASDENLKITSWSNPYSDEYNAARTKAIDFNGNKSFDLCDYQIAVNNINNISLGTTNINQITGTIEF